MRATIDKAGRVVVPRPLRDQVGLIAGDVEVTVDGAGIRIEPIAATGLERVGERLVIPASGHRLSRADVDRLRRADQR